MKKQLKNTFKIILCTGFILGMTGCGGMVDRLANIGKEPKMTKLINPHIPKNYKSVSLPMPKITEAKSQPNSLWQTTRQTFFKDQRANKVGDILTVLIDIKDTADLNNTTERTRSATEDQGLPNLLGLETQITKVLPEGTNPSKLVGMNSDSTSIGDGLIARAETINLKLAAMIINVLPNGNFIIKGHQEVRVNYELRNLNLKGVIRPEDILNTNSISYDKIAEARISYGGKGNISELQQPRYGQQVFDVLFPF